MAKANWVKIDRNSGSGNGAVDVTTYSKHTGRVARQSLLLFKAAGVETEQSTVYQAGTPEYVDIADSMSSDAQGQVVTISGVSNSSRLVFSLGTGNLQVVLPTHYIANSIETENGAAINGDPGAQGEYQFSIKVTVPANDGTTTLSRQIVVTDDAGNKDVCDLTLAAGEPYIRVSLKLIELDNLGTPVTVYVESNTNWTVE